MTSKAEPLLIFDLDGTLLSVNSFPYWASYMLSGRFGGLDRRERLALSWSAGRILLKRKLRRHSHDATKYMLQELWSGSLAKDKVSQTALNNLVSALAERVRPNLQSLLATVRRGQRDAILATAAAGEYAFPLGMALGFNHILATPNIGEAARMENSGNRKRDRVLSLITEKNWQDRMLVFLTDHEEDLPLMRECHLTLWFGREEDVEELQDRAPDTHIVACRHMPESQVFHLASGAWAHAVCQQGLVDRQ